MGRKENLKRYYEAHKEVLIEKSSKRRQENRVIYYGYAKTTFDSNNKFLDAIKLTAGCIDCGYREQAVALQFDHVFGSKKRELAAMKSYGKAVILEEVMKCEVVCANCHYIRTYARGQGTKALLRYVENQFAQLESNNRTRETAKLRRESNNRFLNSIKLTAGCSDCGYKGHPVALHFDHINGEKSWCVSEMKSFGKARILEEVEKCEIVCANCHAVRTHYEREQGAKSFQAYRECD